MPTLYAPGTTPVAVTVRGFVALEPGTSAALVTRIRTLVADGRGLGGVIEALTGAYGASLTAIPSFAVALADGAGVRLAVRGDFAFDVEADAAEHLSGAGVTTWTERVIPGATRVALTTGVADAPAPAEYPVADGVVFASTIVWDAAAAAGGASGAVPSDVSATVAPAPTPSAPTPSAPEPAAALPEHDAPVAAGLEPARAIEPAREPEPVPASEPVPAAEPEPTPDATATAPSERVASRGPWSSRIAPAPAIDAAAAEASVPSAVIDSSAVPAPADGETLIPADSTIAPPPAAPETPADDESATTGYDHLWGATVMRSVEDAAVRDDEEDAETDAAPSGDHDGATISLAQARAMRAAAGEAAGAGIPPLTPPPVSPLAPPRAPAPGRIRVSTGQELLLDRTVVIGRRPRSTRVTGTDLPHLVAVDSPQQDISRSHVELRVEGESIVATDLRTTNGTTLLRPGSDPVRLHPGEGTVVVPGDVLDLGDGITVAIEGLA